MNIVNIRTAPINGIHQGEVEIMSEKKKTCHKEKKRENTGHEALGDSREGGRSKPGRAVMKNRDGDDVSTEINI